MTSITIIVEPYAKVCPGCGGMDGHEPGCAVPDHECPACGALGEPLWCAFCGKPECFHCGRMEHGDTCPRRPLNIHPPRDPANPRELSRGNYRLRKLRGAP